MGHLNDLANAEIAELKAKVERSERKAAAFDALLGAVKTFSLDISIALDDARLDYFVAHVDRGGLFAFEDAIQSAEKAVEAPRG